jgi:hypothetical protein
MYTLVGLAVRHGNAYRLLIGLYAVVLCFTGPAAASENKDDSAVSAMAIPVSTDSLKTAAVQKFDSLSPPALPSAAKTSLTADQKDQPQKLKLIKRTYGGRQQVLLATGMMIFVVGIMTMAQQWNPR